MQDADRSYPVHLTQTAPVAISPGELLFYDIVDAKSVSRSSVLSCIAEAGGDASLPHAVNVSQFRAWLTACAASQEDKKLIPFSDLCTVVKVDSDASLFYMLLHCVISTPPAIRLYMHI